MVTESRIYWAIIFIIFAVLFHILSPILGPFLFSALLAYLADPIVDKLEKKMNRTLAVATVFVSIIVLLILITMVFIPLISGQLQKLISKLPNAYSYVETHMLPYINEKLGNSLDASNAGVVKELNAYATKFPNVFNKIVHWLSGSADWIVAFMANVFLVPVVTFYLLRDWDKIIVKVHDLLPRKVEGKVITIVKEANDMLAAFLHGQFMVMNSLAFIYILGLSIVRLDFAFLIGLLAGWLSFVPYLGLVIGIGVATVMAYVQFADIWHPLAVVVTFVVAQMIEGSVLTPRFVGERIGLHPVAVIFSVLAGGQLAGFAGILLALPVAAILNVVVSHAQVAYRNSQLYN